MKSEIDVLVIEDNEDDALLLINHLKRGGLSVNHKLIDTPKDLQLALQKNWDIAYCDYSMPNLTGMEALRIVRSINADLPFIFVSATIGEDVAVEAMRQGAQDYIMKDNLRRLIPATRRELEEFQSRKSRRIAEQRLHQLAHFDTLTNLPNRFYFLKMLDEVINSSVGSEFTAVIHVDLDRFRTVNDSLGYKAGNIVIEKVSQRLDNYIAKNGCVARLSTDEFAIFIKNCPDRSSVQNYAKTLLNYIQIPINVFDISVFVGASIGISVFPEDALSATQLLGYADIATYRAKDNGGKCYRFYLPEMTSNAEKTLSLERSMRTGFDNGEFYLHYQPQIDIQNRKLLGVEALIRWQHPQRGNISPGEFIPIAEETGFIFRLGEWVIKEACRQLQQWNLHSHQQDFKVAVNVSARQFHSENLVNIIKSNLQTYHINPRNLELEITETTFLRDIELAKIALKNIRKLGVTFALDDFGTGYSSLTYLKAFKTDFLKIDQSFIRDIPNDKDDIAIVSAIIAMSKKLSLTVIAEGVETEAQMNFLRAQGCEIAQGYFIGRPTSAEAITEMLKHSAAD